MAKCLLLLLPVFFWSASAAFTEPAPVTVTDRPEETASAPGYACALSGVHEIGGRQGVALQGEIEVLAFTDTQMLISCNRGAQIVLGIPKGFYEGYDREIHEIYAYTMTARE